MRTQRLVWTSLLALSLLCPWVAAHSDQPTPDYRALDQLLTRLASLGFSGAVIAAQRGEVGLRKGYGLADRASGRPYTPDTVQTHGSITKQVTAAAILRLESEGKLSTSDTLDTFFDDVPADKRGITVHQLLTHSAGFPGGIGPDNEPVGADEFIRRALAAPLEFEPGSAYEYSNVGYSLAGIIVEKVSGKGYEDYLASELFEPAGLERTGYLLPAWDAERLATGYLDGREWGRVYQRGWSEDGPGWHLRANGGLHTTVDDMLRWLDVMKGQGPLKPDSVERWMKGYVDEGGGDSFYGYGWVNMDSELGRLITHNGGNGVYSADFLWFPEADFFLYIQGNTSVIAAANLQPFLLGALFDPDFALPPELAADRRVDPGEPERREGRYAAPGVTLDLKPDGSRLLLQASGQAALDSLFGASGAQRERLYKLNQQARTVLERLNAGDANALAGLVPDEDKARASGGRLLRLFKNLGEEAALELVGTLAIAPGAHFHEIAPYGSFIRIRSPSGSRMATVLWKQDGSYRGTAVGPTSDFPGFTLVPLEDERFSAVQLGPPWQVAGARFEGDCLVIADLKACREPDE